MEQIDQSHPLGLHTDISTKLADMIDPIKSLAQEQKQDAVQILFILRALEQVHNEICNELLQPALPDSRHALFDLLRDIEANGGWPYIYRINLQQLCQKLLETEEVPVNVARSVSEIKN